MILSNREIHRAMAEGRLRIDPRPEPLEPQSTGPECPFQTTAVDLHLGDELAWFDSGLPVELDLTAGKFNSLFGPNSKSIVLDAVRPSHTLVHGQLVLAKTREKVHLPLVRDGICLAARVEGRSSYVRCGLLVHFTAPTIHAGFEGTITLELYNHGPYNIKLTRNMPVCQLIVEEVSGTPFANESQFQGQARPGGGR